jgi:hypothetical protein
MDFINSIAFGNLASGAMAGVSLAPFAVAGLICKYVITIFID